MVSPDLYEENEMETMNGARVLVKSLEDLGVDRIFGYTGAAILPVFDALAESSIEVTISSNEQSAAFSAAGYSRSTENVGVAIVTSGPAVTNTLTAVADAYGDSIPLLVFAGQVPEHKMGTDSFQHINVEAIFSDAAKKVITLKNSQDIESIVKDTYYLAKSGKPGPAVIDFPLDKQSAPHEYRCLDVGEFEKNHKNESHMSDGQCQRFFELLTRSERPLLYIGGGLNSKRASEAVRDFNLLFDIPSVNTLMAKGVVDEGVESNLGMLGMFGTPYANMIIQENDLFFAIGVRWDDRVAEKVGFAIQSDIAYIDINPEKMHQIMSERSPKFTFLGDAVTALEDLTDYAKRKGEKIDIGRWREKAVALKKIWPLDYNRASDKIQSAEVIDELSKRIGDDTIITTGVGNHQMLCAQYLKMRRPKTFLTSGSFGTMGFSLPTAIGAHYANPGKKIIAVDGDGSMRMNLGELHTISTYELPIKVLMLNNRSDGMVQNLQDAILDGRRTGTERAKDINFAQVAEKMGFTFARRLTQRETIRQDLDDLMNSSGPGFLEVVTDAEEILYPKVKPGSAYKDMDLGPYIRKKL